MLIRRRVALLALVPSLALACVFVLVAYTRQQLAYHYQEAEIAERLQEHTLGLVILTYDYLRSGAERPAVQWRETYNSMGKIISLAPKFPRIEALEKDYERIGNLFSQTKHVKGAEYHWVVSRLLIYAQSLYEAATRLREAVDHGIQDTVWKLSLGLLAISAVGAATIGIVAYRVVSTLGNSISQLSRAASKFSEGDLSYRASLGTRDELGQLGASFNLMAEELASSQAQLVESEKLVALGTLAAGVAHELNNPLMGVMNYVEQVRQAAPPENQRILGKALRELTRMRDLLKNMLAFSQPSVGRLTPARVERAIERAIDLMEPEFKARGIDIQATIAPLPEIRSNEDRLQQVLVNVLMNARDAVEKRAEKMVRVNACQEDGRILIEVTDTGTGVPAEHVSRIFDAFFTTKSPGKGTGLGLSVSRTLMAGLGGTIEYVPGVPSGATFRLTLPLSTGQDGLA